MYFHSVSITVSCSLIVGVLADQRIFDISSHNHFCPTISHPSTLLSSNSTREPSNIPSSSPYRKNTECTNPNHTPHDPPPLPWTQEPLCTETFPKGEPYCIFTSSTFNNNRGISIFTTPSIAADFASHPAFTNSRIHAKVAAQNMFPFVQQEIPGKGLGLIASKTLYPGDRIFAYTPATMFHGGIFEEMAQEGELGRIAMQRETANRLPKELKEKWWALLGHFGEHSNGDEQYDLGDDIINTNSFEESFGTPKEEHFLVLPETARINHDCRPNGQYYFDRTTFTHYVHAITTIHPGEELSISYTDPLVPRSKRRRAIKRSWGFDCSCSLCTQSSPLTIASDARIAQILETEKLLDDWTSPESRRAKGVTPQMAEYVVELYGLERLWAPRAEAYYRTALAWSSVGDEWRAMKWAEIGVKAAMVNTGPGSIEVVELNALCEDPSGHWSWRWMEGWDGIQATKSFDD